jgi:hypothetical protein
MLVRNAEVLTPFLYIGEPIGRSIGVQPAVGRNSVDDDCVFGKDTAEYFSVLGVEALDVFLN